MIRPGIAAVLLLTGLLPATAGAYPRPAVTEAASVSSDGAQTEGACGGTTNGVPSSFHPVISGNGRFVAFDTCATNLAANDHDGDSDVFVHDMLSGKTQLVSAASTGVASAAPDLPACDAAQRSMRPSIDDSGRFIAFESCAMDLVPLTDDLNPGSDIFVRDVRTGRTELVSIGPDGAQLLTGVSSHPFISRNGRYVAFVGGPRLLSHVYVRDLRKDRTVIADVSEEGDPGNGAARCPSVTASGRFVAFESDATNLVGSGDLTSELPLGAASAFTSVYVKDLKRGRVEAVSGPTAGSDTLRILSKGLGGNTDVNGSRINCGSPSYGSPHSISESGRYVAFVSSFSDLVPNDTNTSPIRSFTTE